MFSFSEILFFFMIITFFNCINLVIFGQVTVRKLRKNPEVKPYLGISLLSGWDILNVASALSLPLRFLNYRAQYGDILNAEHNIIRNHATKLDFFLARIFYWPLIICSFSMLFIFIFRDLGFIN